MNALSRIVIRYAGWVVLALSLLSVGGAIFTVELYKNLRPDLEELLPTTARSVVDLNTIINRISAMESIVALTFSDDPKASRRFIDDLAKELKNAPPDLVAGIEYEIKDVVDFFEKRAALFVSTDDLKEIRNYVQSRLQYEIALRNPITIFDNREIAEPQFDILGLRQRYTAKASSFVDLPDGYYATQDQKIRAMIIYFPGKMSDIPRAKAMRAHVDGAIAKLNPKSYAPDLEVHYTGGVQNILDEHAALIADLGLSTVVVIVFVTLAMWIYFRTVRGTLALVISLLMGTLWTFGLAYFLVGYLNANTAFLGSIVMGNGINYGIIFLSRYLEERRKGGSNPKGIYKAMSSTWHATFVASLAAGLAYGSLILMSFRGFNQFGVIGFIGMAFCWMNAYLSLPALLTLFDKYRPLVRPGSQPPKAWISETLAKLVERFPRVIWASTLILAAISLAIIGFNKEPYMESNLLKLRDKKSLEEGSGYYAQFLNEIFNRDLVPLVVLAQDRDDAQEIASKIKKLQESQKEKTIRAVSSIDSFIPENQTEKINILREIQASLSPRIMTKISQEERDQIKRLLRVEAFEKVDLESLPSFIIEKFREKDGSVGKLVLIEPVPENISWSSEQLSAYVSSLREIADSVRKGTPVTGQVAVSADILDAVNYDGPRATLFAFIAVVILVILLFRKINTITQVLFALILGVIWMVAYMVIFDLKINFLNFIAFPITFGIGLDYGVNMFSRFKQEGGHGIVHVIRNTGGAVLLASLTTIIGYGSLILASNQAFVSFGEISVLSEVTCVVAAVISLPAYLTYREQKQNRLATLKKEVPVSPEPRSFPEKTI